VFFVIVQLGFPLVL